VPITAQLAIGEEGYLMATNGHDPRTETMRSAVQYLHSIPTVNDEYDQIQGRVLDAHPQASEQELFNRLLDALIHQSSQGGIY
jgi:hypothetical protein